jgi:hypothetical protein
MTWLATVMHRRVSRTLGNAMRHLCAIADYPQLRWKHGKAPGFADDRYVKKACNQADG